MIFCKCGGFDKSRFEKRKVKSSSGCLLAAGVLGDSLGALRDGVFGQLSRQKQAHSSLDLPTGDGVLLVVVSKTGGLCSDALKDVVDERVHDAHGLAGDSGLWVDLLQDFVDVDGVALLAPPVTLLVFGGGLALRGGFLFTFLACYFARHDAAAC